MAEYYLINEDFTTAAIYYDRAAAMGMQDAQERADKARAMMQEKG